ncbi:MAG: polysaccharide biosynthesis C-terminal domain-containing protein, partial [Candidatus Komeilibacteria bacterium]|nr:polysaccharide biosynthesis C-terminal domain-containing protein [Candidatus Komeilibacteria bacterium]
YSSMDMVMLSKMADDTAMGLYSVPYKVTFALQFVAVAFSAAVYPAFCSYFAHGREKLAPTFVKSMRYLMMLSLPISFGLIAIGDKIIGPVFGSQYQLSLPALYWLISSLTFVFLCFPIGAMLNACNRQSRNTLHLGLVALANIILNLIFIPLWSFVGAAAASFLSYGLLFFLGLIVVGQITVYDKKYLLLSFAKVLVSAAVMAAAVFFLKSYGHFVVAIPVGVLIYLMVLWLVKGLAISDFKEWRTMLAKKPAEQQP